MSKRPSPKRRVMVVTGSRSEFGLLRPVMEAVKKHKDLTLQVVAAGEHLLAPANTWREVEAAFGIDAKVPMQKKGDKGRADHAAACGRGMEGFARVIRKLKPDWVVVLGDRIEAFAAASAASIAGVAVCHIHGGDRAEGIADEAMRHAITKLAHLHCAATKLSAERITKMGEAPELVHTTGSPAIDALAQIKPLTDDEVQAIGTVREGAARFHPVSVVLMHPTGTEGSVGGKIDQSRSDLIVASQCGWFDAPVLALMPNHDPGHHDIEKLLGLMCSQARWSVSPHLPRATFVGLLKWMAAHGVPLVGNSSAGLIECESLGVLAINIGHRQAGRERGSNVLDVPDWHLRVWDRHWPHTPEHEQQLAAAKKERQTLIVEARDRLVPSGHFGDGRAGPRIADLLARTDPHAPALLRKRIAY